MKTILVLIIVCIVGDASAATCTDMCWNVTNPGPIMCGVNMVQETFRTFTSSCYINLDNCQNGSPVAGTYGPAHIGPCKVPDRNYPAYFYCQDATNLQRFTSPGIPMPTGLSPDSCMHACIQLNASYTHFGLQNGNICNCGTFPEFSFITGCNVSCPGLPGFTCGGVNSQDTYYIVSTKYPKVGQVDPTVGAYAGCYLTLVLDSFWAGRTKFTYNTSPSVCSACVTQGRGYFALESQINPYNTTNLCSCGDVLPTFGKEADSYCNGVCAKGGRFCGSNDGVYSAVYMVRSSALIAALG